MDKEPIHKPSPGPDINFVYNKTAKFRHRRIVFATIILLVITNIGIYYLSQYLYNDIINIAKSFPSYTHRPSPSIGSGQVSPSPEFCAQVITRAQNPQTGEVHDFPTPCDVPTGWVKI